MENIIDAIKQSLKDENYIASLLLSLAIPDICGKMGNNPGSSSRYIQWFQKYMEPKYNGFLSGNDCYALRCAVLHEASDNITTQNKQEILEQFYFVTKGPHCIRFSNTVVGDSKFDKKELLQLSVYHFCDDIINAVHQWLIDIADDLNIQKNIQSMIVIHKPGERIGNVQIG
jgi:hypothetical protein